MLSVFSFITALFDFVQLMLIGSLQPIKKNKQLSHQVSHPFQLRLLHDINIMYKRQKCHFYMHLYTQNKKFSFPQFHLNDLETYTILLAFFSRSQTLRSTFHTSPGQLQTRIWTLSSELTQSPPWWWACASHPGKCCGSPQA